MSEENKNEEAYTIGLKARLLTLNAIIQLCQSEKDETVYSELLNHLKACSSSLQKNDKSKMLKPFLNEKSSQKRIDVIDNNTETKSSDTITHESLRELYRLNNTLKKIRHNYHTK